MKQLTVCIACLLSCSVFGDVTLENRNFRLVIGDDATAKSLVLKANGEECLDAREGLPVFSVTQERPFNNENKLKYPNKRTTYRANRVRREGDKLIVGFETAAYEARIAVKTGEGYVSFTLEDFICEKDLAYEYISLDVPPVAEFRVLQLPVKDRANVADWLNGVWDDRAATAVVAGDPYADADHERRFGFQLLSVDLRRGVKLRGGSAAVVCGAGREAFLDAMDGFERDMGLPRGVQSRRDPRLNQSIAWTAWANPANFDGILEMAKRGGFRMMMLYYSCFTKDALEKGYWVLHDYNWADGWTRGWADLDDILGKIKGAGMMPGLHVLQTHVGLGSSYVTPVADPRLGLKRRLTLAQEIPANGAVDEIRVFENPVDSPMWEGTRILKFGGELFSYEGYTTTPPYRFTGVKRGDHATRAAAHPYGEIGGVLDVCEYSAVSCYADQDTDLPVEIGAKIARIYDRGFEFLYFDGSEGVRPPCNVNVSLAQWHVTRQVKKPPLFTEGAAKTHFGWHLQAGGNAFDIFPPEVFKKMIVAHPQAEAPLMAKEMTRLDFGWWATYLPGEEVTLKDRLPFRKVKTVGTQPDMWEFGTSRAAAWDCPTTVTFNPEKIGRHPRRDDLLEVMRRWEDVRAKNWLTPEMKEALKSSTQEHHLYLNEKGEYELHEIEMLPTPEKAPWLRGFVFERKGRRVIAYWHTSGSGRCVLADGKGTEIAADGIRYFETDASRDEAKRAFAGARPLNDREPGEAASRRFPGGGAAVSRDAGLTPRR